jgi:hypothetical protein
VSDGEFWQVAFTPIAAQTRKELPPGPIRAGFDGALDVIGYTPLDVGRPLHPDGLETHRTFRCGSAGLIVYLVDEAARLIVIERIIYAG